MDPWERVVWDELAAKMRAEERLRRIQELQVAFGTMGKTDARRLVESLNEAARTPVHLTVKERQEREESEILDNIEFVKGSMGAVLE